MVSTLPQQQILLEILIMSGDIAVAEDIEGTISDRTLKECETNGWITITGVGAGFNKVCITDKGRRIVKAA